MSESKFKILLVGKHELACELFLRLVDNDKVDLAVVTCDSEDEDSSDRASLKNILSQYGYDSKDDNGVLPLAEPIDEFQPDILLSAGFDRIIQPNVFNKVGYAVNIHFAKLPNYRGCYSIPWAVINNEKDIGVTLHEIASGIDNGPIILQRTFSNNLQSSCHSLYNEAVELGVEMFIEFLNRLDQGKEYIAVEQDENEAAYYPMVLPYNGKIQWSQTTYSVANFIRAYHFPPYPGAETSWRNSSVFIEWPVHIKIEDHEHEPGTIVDEQGGFWVATRDGFVKPELIMFDKEQYVFDDYVARYI